MEKNKLGSCYRTQIDFENMSRLMFMKYKWKGIRIRIDLARLDPDMYLEYGSG